VLVIWWCHSWC